MDSLTQVVLGAGVAAAAVSAGHRRRALLAGAALGTLPDLDVLIDYGGAVENFTYHRGFSHSLLVLAPGAILLWLALRHWWAPVRESPRRWLLAILLALLTHPLLDAHTAYGTQLFWPFAPPPAMWATLFIIDPLYTLPLLVGVIYTAARPAGRRTRGVLGAALALSSVYLCWSWAGQALVRANAEQALAEAGVEPRRIFVTPTPFNTLLWRVVVMTDSGYLEGFDSVAIDDGAVRFNAFSSDVASLAAASDIWAVARLRWFSSDFVRARVVADELKLADLRMGQEPVYVFTHLVARRGNPHWRAIPTRLLPTDFGDRALGEVWQRIWQDPSMPKLVDTP